jgi:hypothetical protein
MRAMFWLQNLKGRDHSTYLAVDERIILDWILKDQSVKLCTGFILLRIGISGGLLCTR